MALSHFDVKVSAPAWPSALQRGPQIEGQALRCNLVSMHGGLQGTAIAIGEQPIKGLLSPAAMGRLCVGEMLTNLVAAPVSSIRDIKVRLRPRSSRLRCGLSPPSLPSWWPYFRYDAHGRAVLGQLDVGGQA
jgi:hypothetical protein